MVFGNVDVERLQLNEDTVWAGGPYDSSNPAGAGPLAEIRRLVFQNRQNSSPDFCYSGAGQMVVWAGTRSLLDVAAGRR
jgi:hypothetical protein